VFDGDEMNIHVPQKIQTRIELEEIANVRKQLITPSRSVPIYGIVQDGLLGAYNLTDDNTRISWRNVMNILSHTTFNEYDKIEKDREYTGKELFSMIIPNKISMKMKDVEIVEGKLIKGKINKSIIGAKSNNGLLQYIWDEYGEDRVCTFIDDCQKMVNNFNLINGFTVGISDAKIPELIISQINEYLDSVVNKIEIDITNAENNPLYMTTKAFEKKLFSDTNIVRDDVAKIVIGSISKKNNFHIMMSSGSKGGSNNLGQMIGAVGQQSFEGGIMPKSYADRSLCYFYENDDSPVARGLCHNSYMNGLTYPEFCFHMNAGRGDTIVKQLKTAESGYAQRKLVKTMEDVMIKYDGTVRIANNQIIQQIYGGNGNDTTMQYTYNVSMIEMNNETMKKNFSFNPEELKEFSDFNEKDNEKLLGLMLSMRDNARINYVKASQKFITMNSDYKIAINLNRIVASLKNTKKNSTKDKRMTPKYILTKLEEVLSLENTPLIKLPKNMKISDNIREDEYYAKTILRLCLYDALNPKKYLTLYDNSFDTFNNVIESIQNSFNDNIIEAGSMIGVIAAQSLGEAVTQITMNQFHLAGIASLTYSSGGVPRINELISASKNPKTPQMFVYLEDNYKSSRDIAHKISSYLEKTTMGDIRGELNVYYDPEPNKKDSIMSKDGITETFYSKKLAKNSCSASINNLPWLFRIEIDKEKMLDKNITLLDIKTKLCLWWEKRHSIVMLKKEKISLLKKITSFAVLSNSDNDEQPIIHIRFNVKDTTKLDNKKKTKTADIFNRKTLIDFVDMLDKFKIKGVEDIERIHVISKDRFIDAFDKDGMKIGEEQVIFTSGVNLKDIRYITGINPYKTFSDDVMQTYQTFGIEFARNRLINEFIKAYDNAGNAGLNPQHISILVDIMCFGGIVISADRHGMNKANIDPLSKASFEKPIDVYLSSSVFGEIDKMNSVSSILHVGGVFKGGTGYPEIQMDIDMIKNSEYIDKEDKLLKQHIPTNTITNAIMDENDSDDDLYMP